MSWDKNTVNYSELDAVMKVLDDIKVKYKLSVITAVEGRGLNDGGWDGTDLQSHELRRLQFKNCVILEYIEQDADCDTDDTILSHKFSLSEEPQNWEAVIKTDKNGQYTRKEYQDEMSQNL